MLRVRFSPSIEGRVARAASGTLATAISLPYYEGRPANGHNRRSTVDSAAICHRVKTKSALCDIFVDAATYPDAIADDIVSSDATQKALLSAARPTLCSSLSRTTS
jgi:hypothetical protein